MLSRLLTIREQMILLTFAIAMVIGPVILYLLGAGAASTPTQEIVIPLEGQFPNPTPEAHNKSHPENLVSPNLKSVPIENKRIGVAVMGAVQRPGFYWVPGGTRVKELLLRAGGAAERSDLSGINMSALLVDTSTLTIPGLSDPGTPSKQNLSAHQALWLNPPHYLLGNWQAAAPGTNTSGWATSTVPTPRYPNTLIRINSATMQELETLPGIGPVTAQKIVAYRQSAPFCSIEDLLQIKGIGTKKLDAIRALITVY
jgi:competence protein ComEA